MYVKEYINDLKGRKKHICIELQKRNTWPCQNFKFPIAQSKLMCYSHIDMKISPILVIQISVSFFVWKWKRWIHDIVVLNWFDIFCQIIGNLLFSVWFVWSDYVGDLNNTYWSFIVVRWVEEHSEFRNFITRFYGESWIVNLEPFKVNFVVHMLWLRCICNNYCYFTALQKDNVYKIPLKFMF